MLHLWWSTRQNYIQISHNNYTVLLWIKIMSFNIWYSMIWGPIAPWQKNVITGISSISTHLTNITGTQNLTKNLTLLSPNSISLTNVICKLHWALLAKSSNKLFMLDNLIIFWCIIIMWHIKMSLISGTTFYCILPNFQAMYSKSLWLGSPALP